MYFLICNHNTTQHSLQELSYEYLNDYIGKQVVENKLTETQIKHLVSSIKLYYEKILGRRKMFFKQEPVLHIKPVATILAFDEIQTALSKITGPHDKLLLFLVYYIGLTAKQLAALTLTGSKKLIKDQIVQNNPIATQLYKTLLTEHYNALEQKPKKYLFEKDAQPYSQNYLRKKVYEFTGRYKLAEVYRKQYQNAINQTTHSAQTKKVYVSTFLTFLKAFGFKHPALIQHEKIREFLTNQGNKSEYYQNLFVSALKFYYQHVLHQFIPSTILVRPKKSFKLTEVLSVEEIYDIINCISNIKHKCLIAVTYSSGMRREEVLSLKTKDIDFTRKSIFIRSAKGKKDRYVFFTGFVEKIMQDYLTEENPGEYFFKGATGGKYSATSLTKVLKKAAEKANISKRVHPHLLRHSIATHLIEQGVDISVVQQFLGHNDVKTTIRYTHIAKNTLQQIINPLESFTRNMQNQMQNNNNRSP